MSDIQLFNDYIPDSLFPSDNDLEIPSLDLSMQAESCEIPFVCYGEQKRTFRMKGKGTLHFYTDDYRFSTVYDHPDYITRHEPRNIVEPNYSLFNETPIAFGLQAIYKKRTLARALQDQGIRVFADLNVANKFYAYNLIGIPPGWGAFCTRGYADRIHSLEFEWMIAQRIADGNKLTFVVYGGGRLVKAWCQEHGAVYVNPIIDIKDKTKAVEKIRANTDTGLFLPELNFGKTLPMVNDILTKQVVDYRPKKFIKEQSKQ